MERHDWLDGPTKLYNDSDESSANNTMGIILKELLIFEVEVVIV